MGRAAVLAGSDFDFYMPGYVLSFALPNKVICHTCEHWIKQDWFVMIFAKLSLLIYKRAANSNIHLRYCLKVKYTMLIVEHFSMKSDFSGVSTNSIF